MSKECRECDHFGGWSWDDGTPYCNYEDEQGCRGYEYCPYNDQTDIKNKGMKVIIDSQFMSDYIRHTIQNTVESKAESIASAEVKKIIDDEMREEIRTKVAAKVDAKIDSVIDKAFNDFLDAEICIGGFYSSKKMTRRQYIAQEVENRLSKIDVEKIQYVAHGEAAKEIESFTKGLQKDINKSVKTYFDEATRQTLTENVVSMLMCSDTYKKLSDGMARLLPQGDK